MLKRNKPNVLILGATIYLALATFGGEAGATSVIIGAADSGNCYPFGCAGVTEYQQVYASTDFSGTIQIGQIDFFDNFRPGGTLDNGTFTLTLSYTSSSVGGLSTNFNSNIGADATTVFSGTLPAIVNGELTFLLPTQFSFNPTVDNLLLTVTSSNSNNSSSVYLDAGIPGGALFSRAYDANGVTSNDTDNGDPTVGLVTEFDPSVTPIPSALPLFAGGLGMIGLLSRRRKRKAALPA
jgi:hypothetical protein